MKPSDGRRRVKFPRTFPPSMTSYWRPHSADVDERFTPFGLIFRLRGTSERLFSHSHRLRVRKIFSRYVHALSPFSLPRTQSAKFKVKWDPAARRFLKCRRRDVTVTL